MGGRTGTPWERRAELGFFAALVQTTTAAMSDPVGFYKTMRLSGGIGAPLGYAVIVGYVGMVASAIYDLVFRSVIGVAMFQLPQQSDFERALPFVQGVAGLVLSVLFGPLLLLVGYMLLAAIMHAALMLLGAAREDFEATLRVVCYAQAPAVLNFIPGCGGLIGLVYSVVLAAIGLSDAHQAGKGQATLAALSPTLVCCCCCAGALVLAGLAGVMAGMSR